MSHNFVKQSDGTKFCSNCGDEKNTDPDRDCSRPQVVQSKLHYFLSIC